MRLQPTRAVAVAPSLPLPYPALWKAGVRLRPGQLSLWVAAPGVGKSQLLNNIVQRMPATGGIYWSADTDRSTITCRSLAMWSGYPVDVVEEFVHRQDWSDKLYGLMGDRAQHVEWVFDPLITSEGVERRLNAYGEIYGRYPDWMVLDNLSNMLGGSDQQEHQLIRDIESDMQRIARHTRAHVAILHHAKGQYDDGSTPIPQSGTLQNACKIPEVVVTLYHPGGRADQLGVCIVKHRGGPADPAASPRNAVVLDVDYSRATVHGFEGDPRYAEAQHLQGL